MIEAKVLLFSAALTCPIIPALIYGAILEHKNKIRNMGRRQFEDAFPKVFAVYIVLAILGLLMVFTIPSFVSL